jgi:hypothetical protein
MHINRKTPLAAALVGALALMLSSPPALAQEQDADALAKKLANPVAALISVPFQENLDYGYANDGWRSTLNIQPVIPISLNEDWNMIQRVILPWIYQDKVVGNGSQAGFGDTVSSTFFSPKAPTAGGLIWGVGPVFLLPTAGNDAFAGKQWGAGPTALVLVQDGPWTKGFLVNHIASFAGSDSRAYINATFLQPFLTYGAGKGRSYSFATESTYDWNNKQWTVPVIVSASQVMKFGGQLVSLSLGVKVYLDQPTGGPTWGLRFGCTLLFPK